jgi:hypothetical protein
MPEKEVFVAARYEDMVLEDQTVSVTIAWDDDQQPKPAGYFVYVGTQSRNYDRKIDAGLTLSTDIDGLEKDNKYYVSATSYDSSGNESGFSDEISFNAL